MACGAPVIAGLKAPDIGVFPFIQLPLIFAAFIALRAGMTRLKAEAVDICKNLPERLAFEYLRPVHV